jgi:hypothetical protein
MSTSVNESQRNDIRVGNQCLLKVMNQHFMVEILRVDGTAIETSFPGSDYPIAGMGVDLQFHDKHGFNSYQTTVFEGPQQTGNTLLLNAQVRSSRAQHRDSCRVPTDLTVQAKDQVHVRRYDAALRNLSAGGALLETIGPFELGTTLEITLSLPGEPTHGVLGRVVHASNDARRKEGGARLLGVRFVSPDAHVVQSIVRYIWNRLRDLYPPER